MRPAQDCPPPSRHVPVVPVWMGFPCFSSIAQQPAKAAIMSYIHVECSPGNSEQNFVAGAAFFRQLQPPAAALDFSPRSGPDLFLSILFAGLPDSRPYRPGWRSARAKISCCGCAFFPWMGAPLVCAFAFLAFKQQPYADGHYHNWAHRLAACSHQSVAAAYAAHLLFVLFVFCNGRRRFLKLSIRRNASGSRIHLTLLRPARSLARTGSIQRAFLGQHVSAAMGVVPHLL